MRFAPSSDAEQFATTVRELLDKRADSAALRAAWDAPGGRIPGLWAALADLGVCGMTVPEAHGGLDLAASELVPVLEAVGRSAAPEPLVETLVGACMLAADGGPLAAEWLPRIADGSAVVAVTPAGGEYVPGAEHADLFILAGADGAAYAVPAGRAWCTAQPTADQGLRLATVEWPAEAGVRLAADGAAAADLGILLVATELIGLADAMLEMAVRYAGQREQFGRPIGSFQAVKHALADVYVAVSFARPVVARAGWSVAHGLASRARDVSHAKHAAGAAATRAARTALQVHGGIGYTYEHDLHMWLKRTWALTTLWGDAAWHRARVAAGVTVGPEGRVP